jgi:hypothetical protein
VTTADEWAHWIGEHDDPAELKRALKKDPSLARARTTEEGNTLLHWACWHKKLAMVELLVAAGADVNARGGDFGFTPLHCTVHDADPEEALPVVRFLVEHDALPELEDRFGHTVPEFVKREMPLDPNAVLAVLGAKPVDTLRTPPDYEGTVAVLRSIQSEGETISGLRRMIEAFRDGARFDISQVPGADASCLQELQMILDTVAGTSWAEAARKLVREQFKPAHAKRLLGFYR